MRKGLLLAATVLIGIGLLIFTFQLFPFQNLIELLVTIDFLYLIPYLGVSFLIFCILTLRWHVICKQHNMHIPFFSLLGYRYVGFGVSFLTPGPRVGGEPVRAALLRRESISFPKALSTVVADKTVELASFGIMIALFSTIVLFSLPLPKAVRVVLGTIAVFILLCISISFFQILRGKDPVKRFLRFFRLDNLKIVRKHMKEIQEFEHNITKFYGEGRRIFWGSFALSGLAWLISLIEFKLLLLMLGISATLPQIFLIYAIVGIVYMIPIPLALGSLEAAQTSIFSTVGFPKEAGVALAMFTRGRDLLWTLIGFMLLGYYGFDAIRTPRGETK